jgi:hypothetical protein
VCSSCRRGPYQATPASAAQEQLRRMVRSALRSVRRGYAEMSVKGILDNPRQGGDCLADFIVKTRGRELRRFDLSTVMAERTERIALLRSR